MPEHGRAKKGGGSEWAGAGSRAQNTTREQVSGWRTRAAVSALPRRVGVEVGDAGASRFPLLEARARLIELS
jgi:hypothetical protein